MDKSNIIETRIGGLGSSDAKMVTSVGRTGQLNETARRRIAQMLGLIEKEQVTTAAMQKGNEIEEIIFESVHNASPIAVSNPYYKSEELSEIFGFDIFNHIDIEVSEKKLAWYEVKATIKTPEETINEYLEQLAWHYMLGSERAYYYELCPFRLYLIHYNTSDGSKDFNSENLTKRIITEGDVKAKLKEIKAGLAIISDAIKAGFEYIEIKGDESLLPVETQAILPSINNLLRMAQDAQEKADKLKEELRLAMEKFSIKKIENDYFNVTFIPAGVQARFDDKEFQKDHPELYSKYLKNSNVKSQIRIKLKD